MNFAITKGAQDSQCFQAIRGIFQDCIRKKSNSSSDSTVSKICVNLSSYRLNHSMTISF